MAGTAFYQDELCYWHTTGEHVSFMPVGGWLEPLAGNGHPESPASKRRLKSLLDVSGLTRQLTVHSAEPASRDDLLRVHTVDYLDRLKAMSDAGGGQAGYDAPFGAGSYEIACLSAGLAKQAVADVWTGRYQNAYSLSRPPGHHCLPDKGFGFCLLANIPVAIEAARAEHGLQRVAVVDWDVHHGNGTEAIFYDRSDVLTISLHQDKLFPQNSGDFADRGQGDGLGYNLNIPLLPGGGEVSYAYALERLVLPALRAFQPQLIIIANGLDAAGFDPLGRMQLHVDAYRQMTKTMMAVADELCDGKLVVVHEGGYSESYVPFCGLAIVEALTDYRTAVEDPFSVSIIGAQPSERFNALQRELIDEMAAAL
ncbi:MAG: class II histone deacetylase [Anaerolineales bacterium]|nr:class II histone deacetylase [Anaerolineales bacterium]